ncbi:EF-P 5-aminopentanol modification-associated protein YfmF [Streptococcus ovuberis]|uniref:Insulinase family protein n=1 Tax=Streptococcus ovuberis TaxID=1936207 RepID=A0A7X6MZE6_9STRE|nr:pitrilysin family protein [Streptococcus ovuberis]NKZ20603.1 insulinase family protein [Streptococcus ovuberis]
MKLAEGVYLHFKKTNKFKTQRIKVRFSAPLDQKTIASRALIAYLLESANKQYKTPQLFRKQLASLYGATLETNLAKKGAVHIIDLDLSFLSPSYTMGKDLTAEALTFLKTCLCDPLTQADGFDPQFFEIEQGNLLNALESEQEDNFYQAHLAINRLFYKSENLSLPKHGTIDLVKAETPQSVFRSFQRMLTQDRVDIFCLGDFQVDQVQRIVKSFSLADRWPELDFQIDQGLSKITSKVIEKKEANQSILELAYHVSAPFGSKSFFSLLVLNGLLGGFSHSRLFTSIREKEGLAYTIGSQIDSLTSYLNIYAGIDKLDRHRAMTLIHQQLLALKQGQFSLAELEQTKRALKNALKMAEDRQIHLIEQLYTQTVFEESLTEVDNWFTKIDKVSKEDIRHLAKEIKLQAVYFLEGNL